MERLAVLSKNLLETQGSPVLIHRAPKNNLRVNLIYGIWTYFLLKLQNAVFEGFAFYDLLEVDIKLFVPARMAAVARGFLQMFRSSIRVGMAHFRSIFYLGNY
jgi:hypothetical protein